MAAKSLPATKVPPRHPGIVMADILDGRVSLREASRAMGVSHSGLQKVLDGTNGVTAPMALRFAAYSGNLEFAKLLLTMQQEHDLYAYGRQLAAELKAIKPLPNPPKS